MANHTSSDPGRDAADRLLLKLRAFVTEQLDDDEATLFAVLVAPGIARAYVDDEVLGFDADVNWHPSALANSLREAVRENGIKIVGITDAL